MPNFEKYFCSITITKTMINWVWIQVEGHALASVITALAFERDNDNCKGCGVGWLLITINVLQEGNDKIGLASYLLKAYHES